MATLPSDTHVVSDTGHTTDHNSLVDCLAVITGAAPGGAVSVQQAMDTLAGAVTAGKVLRGNGTHVVLASIASGDLPAATTAAQGAIKMPAASAAFKPANPAGTASTAGAMMGLGSTISYTPASSGVVIVALTCLVVISAGAAGAPLTGGRYGTGAAPVNGAALTGTVFGPASDPAVRVGTVSGVNGQPLTITDRLALAAGTAYWFDVAITSPVGTDTCGVIAAVAVLAEQLA